MSKAKRFLSVLTVMTMIVAGIGLSLFTSASGGLGGVFNEYVIFSGNRYPTQPSFTVAAQNKCVLSGLTNRVYGKVHSNYNIEANTSTIVGVGEAVGTVTGENIQYKIPDADYVPMPDFSIYKDQIKADAIAAGQYYSGDFSIANASSVNVTAPLYVEGNANLTGISFSGRGTIYAGGRITITGSSTNYDSLSKICMYSGHMSTSKANAAIDFACSAKDFTGILYAPNGSILVTGSNYTFYGNIVGRVVDVSGSNKAFNSADVSESFKYAAMVSITFDANGGTGGSSAYMTPGDPLAAPTVTREGYTFKGWQPAVPPSVPDEDAVYTALWGINIESILPGHMISYGSYPQTKVTDTALISALNSLTPDTDSNVNYNGEKYKRVFFTQYTLTYREQGDEDDWEYYLPPYDSIESYQDDNGYYINTVYWFKYEPVKWRVLSNTNGELFMLAEEILAAKQYNQAYGGVNWETCTLRSWLNGDFYNAAFSPAERSKIITSSITNAGSANTSDKLFLLSAAEATNAAYGFSSSSGESDAARQAQGTDFSKCGNLFEGIDTAESTGSWWLRSVTGWSNCVSHYGRSYYNSEVNNTYVGVRPVFRINLLTPEISIADYDANGGTGALSAVSISGEQIVPPALIKTGYTLAGWLPALPGTAQGGISTYTAQWAVDNTDPELAALIALAQAKKLPANAANDPQYVPGGEYSSTNGFYPRHMFTQSSLAALETAVSAAQAGQQTVGESISAITAAYNNLVLADADYSELNAYISVAEGLNRDFYSAEDLARIDEYLGFSYDAVAAHYKKPMQEGITVVMYLITFEVWNLPMDKTLIINTWNDFQANYVQSNYTPESWDNVVSDYDSCINSDWTYGFQNYVEILNDDLLYSISALVLAPTYMITFDANGGTEVEAIAAGSNTTVSKPPDPLKDGFTFGGWYLDSALTSVVTWPYTSTSSVTFYAKWIGEEACIITFDANGGTGGTSDLKNPGDPLAPPAVTRTGYTFTGWSPSLPPTVPETESTYTAQWIPNTYTITYNGNGSTAGSTANSSHTYDLATTLTANGFTKTDKAFLGWSTIQWAKTAEYTNEQSVNNITPNQGAIITFYAVWVSNQYTITFNANGGTGSTSTIMVFGSTLTAPVVTKTGYTCLSWSPPVPATVPATNTTYTAQWTANQYDITFNPQGGSVSPTSSTVTYHSTYAAGTGGFPTPTRTGYTFSGWYTSPGGAGNIVFEGNYVYITASQTLYATWTANTYTVTFDAQGGIASPATKTVTYTSTYGTLPTASKVGYTFSGWYTGMDGTGDYIVSSTTVTLTEAQTLFAKWTAKSYTVTFNATGGSVSPSTNTVTYASTYGTLPTPIKTGSTFDGWYTSTNGAGTHILSSSIVTITAAQTLYAIWTANTYLVTFDPQGGSVSPTSSTVSYYSTYGQGTGGLPTPVKTGFAFGGWYTSPEGMGAKVTSGTSVTLTGEQTLYAKWSVAYTVSFDAQGGSVSPTNKIVASGSTYGTLPTPIKTGYTFEGWYTDTGGVGTNIVSSTMVAITADQYLYAKWTARTFTVMFNPQSGTVSPTTSTVTYDSTYGTGTGGFPTPTRAGYTFGGWFTSSGGAGTQIFSTTTAARTSSQTLYAYWTLASFAINFDANGGTGGTSALMNYGSPLTAPVVSKPGYVFTGWTPAVPSMVPSADTTYTAQYIRTTVSLTKLTEGFHVNIKGWVDGYKYQIWTYQKVTSDFLLDASAYVPANQWILAMPYALGSTGAIQPDGSIDFYIDDFISADSTYTVSVRVIDSSNQFVGELTDSYTSAEVQEVKITKVLVDGEFAKGMVIKEIDASTPLLFTVIGNNVANTVFSALVVENGTPLTAVGSNEFSWDTSTIAPGIYTVRLTASNGTTSDTKYIKVQLYSLNSGIQYGSISSLGLPEIADNVLPKTVAITPNFKNGSFYYKVSEPGREPVFTSGLFDPADNISYNFTKYGIYHIQGYVNRTYEVRIGANYDDGFFKMLNVSRSQTEPSSAAVTANADITKPVDKATPLLFTASANIGGIGATPVQYSFWRYDAKGYALVKDWSSDNTLDWTPARVGIYTIEARAKGADAGSYEAAASVTVTVTDGTDQIAQGVVITLNDAELNANATARAPITIKASATSTNSEDLLYKFNIGDSAMGIETVQNYSADSNCVWTPRKAGTYTISVLVKNQTSFGAYDAMETFEIVVL